MMAFPRQPSNQKWCASLAKMAWNSPKIRRSTILQLLLFFGSTFANLGTIAEEPPTGEEHELEELGVNRYTAPSIAQVFKQLDDLKPLPFDELRRDLPHVAGASRERAGLIFGELIADGFLIVGAEKKNLIDDFGRVLMQHARALGVGDRVMRHSASLTELGRRGEWPRMRQELITTQTDVEAAMINLRDEKMAHLISLGGWLRGLEICAFTVEHDFSPERAAVLSRPDLANYFENELKTLPPGVADKPLLEKIRADIQKMEPLLNQPAKNVSRADISAIRLKANELNTAIRQGQ